jgi:hypothetical protein
VGRALRELQLAGLIVRRPGSGSFVGTGPGEESGLLFGLLFPNVADTEIFGPISPSWLHDHGASSQTGLP